MPEYRENVWRPLGYRSYYDYRVHGYGRRPPGEEVTRQARRAYRGHAGRSELIQAINRSYRGGPWIRELQPRGEERGAGGRWKVIRFDAMLADGTRQSFYLRGRYASHQSLLFVKQAMSHPGAARRTGAPPPARAPRPPTIGYGGGDEGGGGGDFGRDGISTGGDYAGEEEELEDETEWDDYEFDYDYEYDWDIPYVGANSVGEFA